jgi:DNA repair protein RecN (Recombination protein N)
MLATLTVSNFALIDNISIDFNNGLSVLTGETGAGKSLIIDAISLLLGGRASTQMIREGTSKAIIEGIFTEYNPKINNILEDIGIEISDEGLIVKREINVNGKSISRINGSMVTLSQLEEVSSLLADIHTQLDTKKLFDLRNYVDFLDDDSVLPKTLEYNQLRKEYLTVVKEYNKIKKDLQDDLDNLDYLKYRYNELKSLHLVKDEVESLEEELKILDNYETIYNSLYTIKNAFHDKDILDTLYDIKNTLLKLSEFDNKLSSLVEIVNNSYYELEDVEKTVEQDF